MQKKISYFLLFFSLLLLLSVMSQNLYKKLQSFPPFCKEPDTGTNQTVTYSGSKWISQKVNTPSQMNAKAYCLMDASSERTLLGKNENQKLPMASTTKIMTCIIALENCDLNSKVSVSSYAASMPDVQLNMQTGDSFFLKDLLYSLMLTSHNDTAVAIAEHIGKSVEGFSSLMNNKAATLGCTNTHFVTPNGLDDKEHYTTAKELCIIAGYAMKNKTFQKIIQTKAHRFSNCQQTRQYEVTNHDAFLSSYPGALGIKTGFTNSAGYCFAGAAKKDGRLLISSVLACGWPPHKKYKWSDTKALMNYGFDAFRNITMSTPQYQKSIPLLNSTKKELSLSSSLPDKLSYPLSHEDTLQIKRHLPKKLTAPVRQGDIIGYDSIYLNGSAIEKFPITAKENVTQRNFSYYASIILKSFFFCLK